MSAAFNLAPGAVEHLRLCDEARPAGYPCAAGSCRFRVAREGRRCAVHEDQAREDPSPADVDTLVRWGWRRAGSEWLDSQGKYRQHWRSALHRIAADQRRGDAP